MLAKAIVGVGLFLSARSLLVVCPDSCLLLLLMLAFLTCMLIRLLYYPNLHTPYISAIDSRPCSKVLASGPAAKIGWIV